MVISNLEASGADLKLEAHWTTWGHLLNRYHIEYDQERGELKTRALAESEIPRAALRFVIFLVRLQDFPWIGSALQKV